MKSCIFFGHRDFDYNKYENLIVNEIKKLIENEVKTFYSGGRGNFDKICERCVSKLKESQKDIKLIKVLSYMPKNITQLEKCYDESIYLLEEKKPFKFAIFYTNRKAVDLCDVVFVGIDNRKYGGAYSALKYAKSKKKKIINIIDM